jgi:tRNA-dihydrouridine synthase B
MQIGPYQLGKLVLAPMAGVTDRPFRQLCRALDADLAVSEMVTSDPTLYGSDKCRWRHDHRGEPGPISVQIAGAEPALLAAAARDNVDNGAQIIDINMGCPAKKVCNRMAGSALLADEVLVGRILSAVVAAVPVPVTLKIRTGTAPEARNALAIARIAEGAGIAALAIHGRTRADAFRGEAEYATIAAVKQALRIPVIANGDIDSPEKARHVLNLTGADALMIGRAAQGNPWIFREIKHLLETGQQPRPPALAEVRQVMLRHLENLYAFYGEYAGLRIARKHIGWYLAGRAGGEAARRQLMVVETAAEQLRQVAAYFDEHGARAAA